MRIRWRGLELPNRLVSDRETLTGTYGKFVAEPFERGFGVTIGNSLRRILLSSLEGSAVTQIKIHGAQHEFTTLPGVVEDMTDVVLNVKSLVVKNHTDQTKVLRKHLNPFVQYTELGARVGGAGRTGGVVGSDAALDQKLNMTLADMKLSVRASNCLEGENINSVRDLVQRSEDSLLEVRNFGE